MDYEISNYKIKLKISNIWVTINSMFSYKMDLIFFLNPSVLFF